ncbi:MAG: lysine--tRNA ligase, partial [Marinilabiliales bacterium]
MIIMHLSEQELQRRESLKQLQEFGIEPYPAAQYEITSYSSEILEDFPKNEDKYKSVSVAGRIMSRRIMGAASFVELQDKKGRIQVYFRRDDICE